MFRSYCQQFDKTSRSKFISGCESMRVENVCSHDANSAHKSSHSAFLNCKKCPAETKSLINDCTISVEFQRVKIYYIKITLFMFDVCRDR